MVTGFHPVCDLPPRAPKGRSGIGRSWLKFSCIPPMTLSIRRREVANSALSKTLPLLAVDPALEPFVYWPEHMKVLPDNSW